MFPNEVLCMIVGHLPFAALRTVAMTSKGLYNIVKRHSKWLPDDVDSYEYYHTSYGLNCRFFPYDAGRWVDAFCMHGHNPAHSEDWQFCGKNNAGNHGRICRQFGVDQHRLEFFRSDSGESLLASLSVSQWSQLVVAVMRRGDVDPLELREYFEPRVGKNKTMIDLSLVVLEGNLQLADRIMTVAAQLGYPQRIRNKWMDIAIKQDRQDIFKYLWDKGCRMMNIYQKCIRHSSINCVRYIDETANMRLHIDLYDTGGSGKVADYFKEKLGPMPNA